MSDSESGVHILERKWVLSEQVFIDNKVDRRRGYDNSFEKLCTIGTLETFLLEGPSRYIVVRDHVL